MTPKTLRSLLKTPFQLADLADEYNRITSPTALLTDEEHAARAGRSREIYTALRPYLLLGALHESESGRLWMDING